MIRSVIVMIAAALTLVGCGPSPASKPANPPLTLQLNWFHDPTFVGYYEAVSQGLPLKLREGGGSISPIEELKAGRADLAVVGVDIFLRAVDSDLSASGTSTLRLVAVDFQRNPVGWVLHPDVGAALGLTPELYAKLSPKERNAWLFKQIASGRLGVGDKRGTESTAIWLAWEKTHHLPKPTTLTPVGFDASVVLTKPLFIYPVYLNEEPYKLSAQLGRNVMEFEPSADGIDIYGNVLITTDRAASRLSAPALRSSLGGAWKVVASNPSGAAVLVHRYYNQVPLPVVQQMVVRTTVLATNKGAWGAIDFSPSGRMDVTINTLRSAGVISGRLSTDLVHRQTLQ